MGSWGLNPRGSLDSGRLRGEPPGSGPAEVKESRAPALLGVGVGWGRGHLPGPFFGK